MEQACSLGKVSCSSGVGGLGPSYSLESIIKGACSSPALAFGSCCVQLVQLSHTLLGF